MSERFLKFMLSSESDYLQRHYPNAFLLLCQIAKRARRYDGHPDGLVIGEAHIGDFQNAGIETEGKYRTAKKILEERGHIQKIETCRSRKKAVTQSISFNSQNVKNVTTGATTVGTKVKLLRSDIWDINPDYFYDPFNDRITTEQRPSNDEQERTRKNNIEKEQQHTDVAVFSCLKNLEIPASEKNRISFSFLSEEQTVIDAVAVVTHPDFTPQESILKSLNAAIKNKWKPNIGSSTIQTPKENFKLSKYLETVQHAYKFIAAKDGLEIIVGANVKIIQYNKSKEKFIKEVEELGKIKLGAIQNV